MNKPRPFVGFAALKRAVSITQVLDRYGLTAALTRSGDSLHGKCPLHDGHNPSQFRVSISKNCWICFGDCQQGGSIIDFVARKERTGIRDAALLIQDWFGVQATDPNPNHGKHSAESHQEVNQPLRFALRDLDRTHAYLAHRGLSPDTISVFGVGYCKVGLMAGWIAIPIHNSAGQLVAYAGRWPAESDDRPRYKLPKGFRKSLELFNMHRASEADGRLPVVVVEGFFGCMRIWQAGYRRVVAIMGSILSRAQEELILKLAGPGGSVVLLFDEDEAGRKARVECKQRLDRFLSVRVATFPTEGMQPDHLGDDQLQGLLTATIQSQ